MKLFSSENQKPITLILICAVIMFITLHNDADSRTYEVKPEVPVQVDSYKSDVVRIVDAYERLMDRYISIVDKDMNRAVGMLDTIEVKIDMLDARLERIERALGILQPGEKAEIPDASLPLK